MSHLAVFMRVADPDERDQAARLAKTSVGTLYQYAGRHRQPGIVKATLIEAATRELNKRTRGRLPIVTVQQMAADWESRGD